MEKFLQYHMDEEHDTLFVRSMGALTTADVMRMNQEIQNSNIINRGWSALIDLRDTEEFLIDTDGMKAIVSQDKELYSKYQFAKLAFVAHQDLVFGMARMYQNLTAEYPLELQVYRELESALDWLGLNCRILKKAYA